MVVRVEGVYGEAGKTETQLHTRGREGGRERAIGAGAGKEIKLLFICDSCNFLNIVITDRCL